MRLFKKRKTGFITVGVRATACMKCDKEDKYNIGRIFFDELHWDLSRKTQEAFILLCFDKKTETIVINQDELMRLIRMANPCQPERPIRLETLDELRAKKFYL